MVPADVSASLLGAREQKEENGDGDAVKSLTFSRDRSGLGFWEVISKPWNLSYRFGGILLSRDMPDRSISVCRGPWASQITTI